MEFKKIEGGVTAALGYKACGIPVGIKGKKTEKKDLALIYSEFPAAAAGVYTKNKYAAAPVKWCKKVTGSGSARAIVINSGNANACTGTEGDLAAEKMAQACAEELKIKAMEVLVCSTGVIGVQMPVDKVAAGIKEAVPYLTDKGSADAAQAIMTTDTFAKEVALEFTLDGKTVKIGGMAKGSGMIHPDMATMLGFVTTDVAMEAHLLKKALVAAADVSFNMITVDGDTSTNDTLLVLANGAAGNQLIKDEESAAFNVFQAALSEICTVLAKMMAKDGEGATKLLEIEVLHARSEADAKIAAKAVAGSSLVKAAFFGEDANWGRIICAVGYSGAEFEPEKADVLLKSVGGEEIVMRAGAGLAFDEDNALKVLKENEIKVVIDLHDGAAKATAWGCDLSYDYVKINGDYRT